MKEVLAELRSTYNIYAPLWLIWTKEKSCRLEKTEVDAINQLIWDHRVQVSLDFRSISYNYSRVRHLLWKLQCDLPRFRRWIIDHFFNCLIYIGVQYEHGIYSFFSTPINNLSINDNLRAALNSLGANHLIEIVALQQKGQLRKTFPIQLLVDCTAVLIQEEQKEYSIKMEVKT